MPDITQQRFPSGPSLVTKTSEILGPEHQTTSESGEETLKTSYFGRPEAGPSDSL